MVALMAAMCTATAAVVTPEVIENTEAFLNVTGGNIAVDGDMTISTNVKNNANVYVRDGELKFAGASTAPSVSLGNIVVSGNEAVMSFENADYSSSAALNHIGGVDGQGTLNITNSNFKSDAEVFTIGVQGTAVGNGSEGTGYADGKYDSSGNGRGDVNITDSTAKLTYRHLQMGEGSLNVDNSTVTIGNKDSADEYYKGFKATMGMGKDSTSTINVTNGGSVEICAARNGKYLGGFSTNYSDGSTANIIVDGGTFAVRDPENADSERYPDGREGNAYIGFSFDSENGKFTKNATTNIEVKNGGVADIDVYGIKLGYQGMSANGTKVNITVGSEGEDKTSSLKLRGHNVNMYEGVTLENHGNVSIDTTYKKDMKWDQIDSYPTYIKGATVVNNKGARLDVVNTLETSEATTITNEGVISAQEITITGDTVIDNKKGGQISTTENLVRLKGNAELINSGTIGSYVYMTGGALTMADGAVASDLIATAGTLSVLGDVVFNGDIMLSNTGFLFTDGATIDLQGHDFSFDGDSITIVVNAATPVMAVFSLEEEEMLASYGITFKNAGTVTGFEDDIEVTIATMDAEGQITETGTYILKSSDVTVQSIPEPTTATLSLLALAGLCARRRRK